MSKKSTSRKNCFAGPSCPDVANVEVQPRFAHEHVEVAGSLGLRRAVDRDLGDQELVLIPRAVEIIERVQLEITTDLHPVIGAEQGPRPQEIVVLQLRRGHDLVRVLGLIRFLLELFRHDIVRSVDRLLLLGGWCSVGRRFLFRERSVEPRFQLVEPLHLLLETRPLRGELAAKRLRVLGALRDGARSNKAHEHCKDRDDCQPILHLFLRRTGLVHRSGIRKRLDVPQILRSRSAGHRSLVRVKFPGLNRYLVQATCF